MVLVSAVARSRPVFVDSQSEQNGDRNIQVFRQICEGLPVWKQVSFTVLLSFAFLTAKLRASGANLTR